MFIVGAGAYRAALVVLLCLGCSQKNAQATTVAAKLALSGIQSVDASGRRIDREITPEEVLALQADGTPYLLVDADAAGPRPPASGPVRIIYFTRTPSFRSAQLLVQLDRNAAPTATQPSQRLTGTPLDWERLKLPIVPQGHGEPTSLTPRQLSQAMRDGVDIQIIDLRPSPSSAVQIGTEFANALQILPDQLSAESKRLSKQRWTVVVDGAGGVSRNAAMELKQQGFPMVSFLGGGYSAWVAAKDRDLGPSLPTACSKP